MTVLEWTWECSSCGKLAPHDPELYECATGDCMAVITRCRRSKDDPYCDERTGEPTQLTPADPLLNECEREKELNNAEV